MKEKLLQYIWQFQHFNKNELYTVNGERLQIINPGLLNHNQGPDFSQAIIQVDDTTWAGNIELHIKSSDWIQHRHSCDENYNNIILHVVWEHDGVVKDSQGNELITLELNGRVSRILLNRYEALMDANSFIPCDSQIGEVNELVITNWKMRLLVERLEQRTGLIFKFLEENNFHWEETFWWLIARSFGITVNTEAFEKIARSLPLQLLSKHRKHVDKIEAMLFGQAGLLVDSFSDFYSQILFKEYEFYKNKYHLIGPDNKLFFLRMRPSNFPSIRLAQLAMLLHKNDNLFSKIRDSNSLKDVKLLFDVTASEYWDRHYTFDELSGYKKKNVGNTMLNNILINTVVPVMFAFGQHHQSQEMKDRAISWLEEISSEKNSITSGFEKLGITNQNAFDSQALLQLKNNYCDKRRCLECAIGNTLLKGG